MPETQDAVQVGRDAIAATPEDSLERAALLNNLGLSLRERFLQKGMMTDLEEAIQVARRSVEMTSEDHPNHNSFLSNLAVQLGLKYSKTGSAADLEQAIQVTEKAIQNTSAEDPNRAGRLSNLAMLLQYKYKKFGAIDILKQAIQLMQKAVNLTAFDSPDREIYLNNLAISLGEKYRQTGIIADCEEANRVMLEALDVTSPKPGSLNNLAVQLQYKYASTGALVDLNSAIEAIRGAIEETSIEHTDRPMLLNNLGILLTDRHSRLENVVDIEEATQAAREAVVATPLDHPERAGRLGNLGIQLRQKYSRTAEISDLEEAIQNGTLAIQSMSLDHPDIAITLHNLGISLRDRYLRTGEIADLEEAIRLERDAIKRTPSEHPDYATFLDGLGVQLGDRYSRKNAPADLDEAIRLSREAVERTPVDHPKKALFLTTLGARLGDRFKKTRQDSDLQAAIECHHTALHQGNSSAVPRITSGLELIALNANKSDWEQAYKAADTAIHLLNILAPRDLENSDKQYMLSLIVGLACDGAAAALTAGKSPLAALELLELGRGVLVASLEEMHIDILNLKEEHPELAERFTRLRNELSRTNQRYTSKKLDNLVLEIRSKIGFHDFLLLPEKGDLQSAASHGPIVVTNVSRYRCDAFLISQTEIRALALPKLSLEDIKEKAQYNYLGSLSVLEWLWDVVASPILDALRFSEPPLGDDWPHVWWIPTGVLSRFPLHAAGNYRQVSQTVLDRVISSYSSSVKTITHCRRLPVPTFDSLGLGQALLVAMEKTPKLSDLPFATEEVDMIRYLFKGMGLKPVEPQRNKQDILLYLRDCKLFHFAGHGYSHATDPLQSFICLEDWRNDRLTVNNLLEINLREHSPFLAYLSACGTGQIKDERFIDESIHLISGFQLAGFRHVIGTLWAVKDEYCLDVSRFTYQEIKAGALSDASVSKGLHLATRRLRDLWLKESDEKINRSRPKEINPLEEGNKVLTENDGAKVKERLRDIDPSDDDELAPLDWVQYVHFGL
ncbi:TPR-like protein [Stipitochalara longipes BDJ]|nr:TPR-like protein [Stipitochalara longipes BDJ]